MKKVSTTTEKIEEYESPRLELRDCRGIRDYHLLLERLLVEVDCITKDHGIRVHWDPSLDNIELNPLGENGVARVTVRTVTSKEGNDGAL